MNILVFVSYATKDADLFKIKDLAEGLTQYEEIDDVLYWQEDMHDNIIKYMNDNLRRCDIVLLLCSPNALASESVEKEWTAAESMKKPIIPIFVKVEHIPALLSSRLGIEFNSFNLPKTIKKLYKLIVKKNKKPDFKPSQGIAGIQQESPKKKYEYYITIGKELLQNQEHKKALTNFQKAQLISEDIYDIKLTHEANSLIKKTEKLVYEEGIRDDEFKRLNRKKGQNFLITIENLLSKAEELRLDKKLDDAITLYENVMKIYDNLKEIDPLNLSEYDEGLDLTSKKIIETEKSKLLSD